MVVTEGKQRPLFAPPDVHKMSCNIEQLCFQRAIAFLSYYLPIEMTRSGYQTLRHVPLAVSDISKSLPHSLVNHQADCDTAVTDLFYRHKCCFHKQLSNKHIFTALSYFPTYQRILCQYTHRTYIHISCPVMYWSHHKVLYWLWMNE